MEKIKRKRGRPSEAKSRKRQYRLLMTEDEFKNLERLSKLVGKSKADVIREGLGYVDSISAVQHKVDEPVYEDYYDEFDDDFE